MGSLPTHTPLMLRWGFTGTLDPVRNLTGLTALFLDSNNIGGTSIIEAVEMVLVIRIAWPCRVDD